MPAQKRYSSNYQDEDDDESLYQPQHRRNQRRRGKQSRRRGGGGGAEQSRAPGDELEQHQQRIELETGEQEQEEQAPNHDQESIKESSEDDSDGSGTDPEDFDELISVSRSEIRGNVQCPICLGIIKRTRVVMGCQHRFCRECIDKSMRLGNNECPACRIHCASRRSLRDDPIFDALIQAIYPDVQKYEEEELVFHEEERALNQQIQASIAQISQRQSEALNKKRKLNKELITTSTPRGSRNYQNAYSRRRRSSQTTELHQSDHNDSEDGCMENSTGRIRENQDDSSGHVVRVLKQETFTWGRGGVRSHVRHGSGGSSRNVRANRLSKLTNYLKSGQRNEFQQDAHVQLVSLDVEETPSLEKPYLCCDSNLSVNDIREHIAREVKSQAKDIELVSLEEKGNTNMPTLNSSNSSSELQILPGQETLAGIQSNYHSSKDLTLGYMQKKTNICILD